MVTTERQNLILDKIVREYITSAKPVSSKKLEKKYRFGLSPATLRIEMQKLTENGFLYQPHTSAGRVPTDKAYRFFVDTLLKEGFFEIEGGLGVEDWFKTQMEDSLKLIQNVTRSLAEASSALATSYLFDDKVLWREGWEEVLQEPEFQGKQFISNFAKLLKNFEDKIDDFSLNSEIKVFIGRENPFSNVRDFSIIISQCNWPEKEQGIISLFGPKRMAYDKNIALINSFKEILKNL